MNDNRKLFTQEKTAKIILNLMGIGWFAYLGKISGNVLYTITLWLLSFGMLYLIIATLYNIKPGWWRKSNNN